MTEINQDTFESDAEITTEITFIKFEKDKTILTIDSSVPVTPDELLELEPLQKIIGDNTCYLVELSEEQKLYHLTVYTPQINIS